MKRRTRAGLVGLCMIATFLPASCDPWWLTDTAAVTEWLTETEQTYIEQINQVRTNPRAYARYAVLPALRSQKARVAELSAAGLDTMAAEAFADLIGDLYYALMYLPPMRALEPALGLTLASRDQCADPNQDGHSSSSPGSETPWSRAAHYSTGAISEIAWPTLNGDEASSVDATNPWSVVLGFLIDFGEINRAKGHRYAILDRDAGYIGIAYGPNVRGEASVYALMGDANYADLDATTQESKHANVDWSVRRVISGNTIDGY